MTALATVQAQQTSLANSFEPSFWIDKFLRSLDVKEKSRQTYGKALKHFLAWMQESGAAPKRETILNYKSYLASKYSACTVSSYLTAVRQFFTYLSAECATPNIAAGIKGAKASKDFRKDALSVAQAREVIANTDRSTLEGKRDYALIRLLIGTGLRTIEVVRADVADLRSKAGKAILNVQGKGRDSKDSFVVVPESVMKAIREYLAARGKVSESAPLFASCSDRNNGGRLTTRSVSRIVKNALRGAGLDDARLTAHSLRHTAVTFALIGGASLQEAQQLARHANINTTLIYSHNLNRVANAAEEKIDALLSA